MKKIYRTLEELHEQGENSALRSCVSSVLAANKYMTWRFLSGSQDGSACHADFVCQDKARGFISRLSYELNGLGQYGRITVEAYRAPAETE